MAEIKRKSVGCLPFLRRRVSRKTSTPPPAVEPSGASSALQRSKSSDSLASISSIDGNRSSLDSFAVLFTEKRYRRTPNRERGYTLRAEKLIMEPYFGHFAGQRLVFDLRKTESAVVSLKVKAEDQVLVTLNHRPGRKETVKDQCLKFAHDIALKSSTTQPSRLLFLCEQTILLHQYNLPVHLLPPRYTSLLNTCSQTVTVRVWPRKLHRDVITLKLKPRISIRELQWMLCKRVGLPNPSAVSLYLRDALEPLSPTSPLPDDCTELECITAPLQQRASSDLSDTSICVSIIGKGIEEIRVNQSMTLYDFEQTVKKAFCLDQESFLYLPQVLRNTRSCYGQPCSLKMHTVLDDNNTIFPLDNNCRNFPTLYGFVSVCESQTLQSLLLYQMTISELDLFKAGPVICFEVTGPTIPISFKTMQANRSTEDVSTQDTRNSIFSVIAIKPHAISVNPDWTMPVLLKYITCISGFPCKGMRIGERTLVGTVGSDILCRTWFTVNSNGSSYKLASKIPEAIPA